MQMEDISTSITQKHTFLTTDISIDLLEQLDYLMQNLRSEYILSQIKSHLDSVVPGYESII